MYSRILLKHTALQLSNKMTHRTKLAYEVVTFISPKFDRDLSVRVNTEVDRVRSWCDYPNEVRVTSLAYGLDRHILTIEYHINITD
jgi:hypothetical protein